MNINTIKEHITRCQHETYLQETKDKQLSDLLIGLPTEADGASFNGTHHSVYQLRRQLYETRYQIHVYLVVLRDAIDILALFDPDSGAQFNFSLEVKIKHLVKELKNEQDALSLNRDSALLNAGHVLMNEWLKYKYSQKFGMFTGDIPQPGGADPYTLLIEE
ncbi:hypothetical protein BGX23_000196 [Mortierella sp. AD031]|nr:hypothetical protein BGX23_000196 [Mortierella sp. AD031]